MIYFALGVVHKRRPQSGGGGLYSADILQARREGILQMQTFALFGVKNFGFFEIYGVPGRTRGRRLSQCGHFSDKGRRVNISRFCMDVLYERPLIKKFKITLLGATYPTFSHLLTVTEIRAYLPFSLFVASKFL